MGALMYIQCVYVVCLFLLNIIPSPGMAAFLDPPAGNILNTKARTNEGKYVYQCKGSSWVPLSAGAELVNISDSLISVGDYSLAYHPANPNFVGTWTLNNDEYDAGETGSATSIVAGNEIVSQPGSDSASLQQVLAEASFHKTPGTAYRVSYIQRLNTKGGLPDTSKCTDKSTVTVPFQAEFWFYTQDTLPPTVPAAIQVPVSDSQVVEGFFGEGKIDYSYDGSQWQQKNVQGKLYFVPGGDELGTFSTTDKPDANGGTFSLEAYSPNGWQIVGQIVGSPVTVDRDSVPWSLFRVTSSSGNVSLVGPFTYYTLVGTRGGVPPPPSTLTKKGDSWSGPFSSQFWTYKHSI